MSDRPESFPATPLQTGIFLSGSLDPERLLHNIPYALRIRGPLDRRRLEEALNRAIARHAIYRSAFRREGGRVVGEVLEDVRLTVLEIELPPGGSLEAATSEFVRPMDLDRPPLMRVSLARLAEDDALCLFDVHHIVTDGTSVGLLCREVARAYNGDPATDPALQFPDHARRLGAFLDTPRMRRQAVYWRERLDRGVEDLRLPSDLLRPARRDFAGGRVPVVLDEEIPARVEEFCRGEGVTPFGLLLGALGLALAKLSGRRRLRVGAPVAARTMPGVRGLHGPLVNMLPLTLEVPRDATVREVLAGVTRVTREAFRSCLYPYDLMVRESGDRDPSRNPLFDAMLVLQNLPDFALDLEGCAVASFGEGFLGRRARCDLTLEAIGGRGPAPLRLSLEYAASLFTPETAGGLAACVSAALREMLADAGRAVRRISLGSEGPRDHAPEQAEPALEDLLFGDGADPGSPALICEDGTITHRDLERGASGVARLLAERGVSAGEVVGIAFPPSAGAVVALTGVLRAGAVFLTLDPEDPPGRIRELLATANARGVLVDGSGAAAREWGVPAWPVGGEPGDVGGPVVVRGRPDDLAYVVFTSGSTGAPKGVAVTRGNLRAYLAGFLSRLPLAAADRVLHHLPLRFDGALEEILPALARGGAVVVASAKERRDLRALHALIRDREVTFVTTVPHVLGVLNRLPPLPSVRTYVSGGDVLRPRQVDRLLTRGEVHNSYGPTETTITATTHRCRAVETVFPIGVPLPGYRVLVVDADGRPLPAGVAGEIAIGGPAVARGLRGTVEPEGPLFLTGDLGARGADGELRFRGRRDRQVKVRGHRVEPGEVEEALLSLPDVEEAVVTLRSLGESEQLLAHVRAPETFDSSAARRALTRRLPAYMVPAHVVRMTGIPRSDAGKVAVDELPAPRRADARRGSPAAPRTGTERFLVTACREQLGVDAVGIDDDLLALGGDSLLLLALHEEIEERSPGAVRVSDLFAAPTIADLAARIDHGPRPAAARAPEISGRGDSRIAVVGLALRFPGAETPDELWENLCSGTDAVREIPSRRRADMEALGLGRDRYPPLGYLDRIDLFDPRLFRLSPKEAALMDPHQRLFSEVAREALLGSGVLADGAVGIYVGLNTFLAGSYFTKIAELCPRDLPLGLTGNLPSMVASRIAHVLDLHGPAVVVDTACSSSLVAVHLACRALRGGECRAAVAGGVKVFVGLPQAADGLRIGIESPDGRTRAFDDDAAGTGGGEGAAAVVLKRLEDARADGDPILAVIRGSAVNQDGRSPGVTSPNPDAQRDVLLAAWRDAGVEAAEIGCVEAHGTGTAIGDLVEWEALARAFSEHTDRERFCALGSVKANLGHLDAAAGVAGLVKCVLMLGRRSIPPLTHFRRLNRRIDPSGAALFVNEECRDWESGGRRVCGVSSFGLSGTNCHVVLEEATVDLPAPAPALPTVGERTRCWLGDLRPEPLLSPRPVTLSPAADVYELDVPGPAGSLVAEHVVMGRAVLPGAAYVHLAAHLAGTFPVTVRDLRLTAPLAAPSDGSARALVVLAKTSEPREFRVLSEGPGGWTTHAEGAVLEGAGAAPGPLDLVRLRARLSRSGPVDRDLRDAARIRLGERWDVVGEVRRGEGEALAELNARDAGAEGYACHPPLLDCGLNLLAVAEAGEDLLVPAGYGEIRLWGPLPSRGFVHLRRRGAETGDRLRFDATFTDAEGGVAVEVRDYRLRRFGGTGAEPLAGLLHELRWVPAGPTGGGHEPLDDPPPVVVAERVPWIADLPGDPEDLDAGPLLRLRRFLRDEGGASSAPRTLVLVVGLAHDVTGREGAIRPAQAAAVGLILSLRFERPGIDVRILDVDDAPESAAAAARLLASPGPSLLTAIREGRTYVPEVVPRPCAGPPPASGVYFVTGGAAGVGLTCARGLAAEEGVRVAVLDVADPADPEGDPEILFLRGDVTDRESVRSAIRRVHRELGPLEAVLHVAGLPPGGRVEEQDEEDFRRRFAVKAGGAVNLLEALEETPGRRHLVLFSSITALTGLPGQGDYAAAGAWLTAFARRAATLVPTSVVSFSAWRETGMVRGSGRYDRLLFRAFSRDEGVAALLDVLASPGRHTLVGRIDPGLARRAPLLARLPFSLPAAPGGGDRPPGEVVLDGKGVRTETERRVGAVLGEVLGLDRISVDAALGEIGVDSLAAVVLAERLAEETGVRLPTSLLAPAASLREIAAHLLAPPAEPGRPVALRVGSGEGDLIVVHDVSGEVASYLPLAQSLPEGISCLGLRTTLGPEDVPSVRSVEDLARELLAVLRAARPEGPYDLAGWSMGGLLAFEMARQVEAGGGAVRSLVVIDCPAPGENLSSRVEPFTLASERVFLARHLPSEALPPPDGPESVRDLWAAVARGTGVETLAGADLPPIAARVLADLGPRDPAEVVYRVNLMRTLDAARTAYAAGCDGKKVACAIDVVGATGSKEIDETRWERHAPRLRVHAARGDHFSVVGAAGVFGVIREALIRGRTPL